MRRFPCPCFFLLQVPLNYHSVCHHQRACTAGQQRPCWEAALITPAPLHSFLTCSDDRPGCLPVPAAQQARTRCPRAAPFKGPRHRRRLAAEEALLGGDPLGWGVQQGAAGVRRRLWMRAAARSRILHYSSSGMWRTCGTTWSSLHRRVNGVRQGLFAQASEGCETGALCTGE